MAAKAAYSLMLWNGKYGNGAKFIARRNSDNKFTEFSPINPQDVAWVSDDLTKVDDYKGWESFEEEPVDNLEDVVM